MTRVQFDISVEMVKELDLHQSEIGVNTRKELFNNALTLLQWAVRQIKAGKIVGSVNEQSDSYSELQMPIFSHVQAKKTAH